MSEQEMLGLAAKAAGVTGEWRDGHGICPPELHEQHHFYWNPLTDDGDCARMNANRVDTDWGPTFVEAVTKRGTPVIRHREFFGDHNNDTLAAWRFASVNVAAEIGRNMP